MQSPGHISQLFHQLDVHVNDVFLISGGILVSHEDIPFCGADALAPKGFVDLTWCMLSGNFERAQNGGGRFPLVVPFLYGPHW